MKKFVIKKIDAINKIAEIHYFNDSDMLVFHMQLPVNEEGNYISDKEKVIEVFKSSFPHHYFKQEKAKKEGVVNKDILELEGSEVIIPDPEEVVEESKKEDVPVEKPEQQNDSLLYGTMYGQIGDINRIRHIIFNVLEELNITK